MSNIPDLSDLSQHAPKLWGSLTAAVFVSKTHWARRIGLVVSGYAAAHYLTPTIATYTKLDEGAAGYLMGMLSMVLVHKAITTIQQMDIIGPVNRWIEKKLGGSRG